MVNYKLGFYNKDYEMQEIDLTKFFGFSQSSNIEELDKKTYKFKDEKDLKQFLLDNEIISIDLLKRKLGIVYKYTYKGKTKNQKLPIVYENDKKYLDEIYLKYKIKTLCSNVTFLEKLANHYDNGSTNFNLQRLNVSDIRIYLSDVRQCGYTFDSKLLDTAIDDLIIKAITSLHKPTGELKENYRGLRDLALFVSRFEKTEELKASKEKLEQIKSEKKHLSNLKKQVREMPNEYEQLTFFDLLTEEENFNKNKKWFLSSEGDPDFPPNSEEEKKYNEYLESLLSMSIDEEDEYYRK